MKKSLLILLLAFICMIFSCSKVDDNIVKPTTVSKKICTVAGVSVRLGPNVKTTEITQLPANTTLEVTDVFGDYVLIKSDKIKGYVWEQLLVKGKEGTVIGGSGASVNAGPNKNTKIGVITAGTKVEILGVAVTWYQIKSPKGKGWIYSGNVKSLSYHKGKGWI